MKKIVNKVSKKDRKGEKKGTEGCAVPSRICSLRYSARCLCAEEPPVSPFWNNVARYQRECKRGSALAYCLKLLIGLRSDTVFPRYALLSLSFSFFLYLSRESSVYFPSQLPHSPLCSALTLSMPIVDDARPSSPIEETKRVRLVVAEDPH